MRLGIDFGTTRTVVACVSDGRHPLVSFDEEHGFVDHVPSMAARVGDRIVYGWEARRVLVEGPTPLAAARSIKRAVRDVPPDERVPGFGVSALTLMTGFLEHLRWRLERQSNLPRQERLEAKVAVPANASSRQRYLTLEAFKRAGFEVLGMVDEPTAAAVEYTYAHLADLGPRSPKRYVVVYDLGGGTFDTSAVSLRERQFEVLATEGIGKLGGDDFDALLLEMALETRPRTRAAVEADPVWRERLLDRCRLAKEQMTPTSKRLLLEELDLGAGDTPDDVVLVVGQIHLRSRPLVDRTLGCLARVLARLHERGIDPEDPRALGAVYLVGGAVAYPPVMRALRERFKRKLKLASTPFASTAVGLALVADPALDLWVRDAVSRHFGVWREAEHGREKVFDPLITKDGSATAAAEARVARREYRPVHPVGRLRFLECTDLDARGQPAGDVTPWDEILFPYDPSLADRDDLESVTDWRGAMHDEHIVETYVYDADGRVRVAIENATRGYRREYQLAGR